MRHRVQRRGTKLLQGTDRPVTWVPQDIRTTYNYNCSIGYSPYTYDAYTGNSSYLEMQKSTNFNSTTGRNK